MAVTIFAAIDVGSYEVSMDIYQISPKIGIEKIDEVRSRIELGHDTYTNGKISYESAHTRMDSILFSIIHLLSTLLCIENRLRQLTL